MNAALKPLISPTFFLLLPLLSFVALAACPVHAGNNEATSHFDGRYRFAGGIVEEHRLRNTVDELVSRFNPFLRGLARRRLTKSTRIPHRLTIDSKQGTVLVDVSGATGGEAAFENGALVQRNSNFEGSRVTSFVLSPDRLRLTMRVTTRSALLPDDLRYELTFVREAESLVGSVAESGSGS